MTNSANSHPPSLQGERVLLTGANGGLGIATSIRLVEEGATVVMACRTEAKAQAARDRVLAATGAAAERVVAAGGFDMLDPDAIADAVDRLSHEPIQRVFLQAGGWVFTDAVQRVSLGGVTVERTIATNVLGAHATLRALLDTGRLQRGRVVIIGGEGARGLPGAIAKPTFGDLADFQRTLAGEDRGAYVPIDALGVAKFEAGLWALSVARRAPAGLEVVWFSPGLIGGTGGTRGMPRWKEWFFQRIAFRLMVLLGKAQWPAGAAAKCVDCLAGRVGAHGDLLASPEGKSLGPLTDQRPMQPHFDDPLFQDAVWSLCMEAVGPLPLSPTLPGATSDAMIAMGAQA